MISNYGLVIDKFSIYSNNGLVIAKYNLIKVSVV